ncbi:hypothetical protein ACIA8O_14225 [Kitasatospora sp. NPDC051853]|uniref:hypothetical protein n=1 Tax=Kitasatospora sp. NPDC051853 TaxID=3364058 RepID=UPI0037A8B74A
MSPTSVAVNGSVLDPLGKPVPGCTAVLVLISNPAVPLPPDPPAEGGEPPVDGDQPPPKDGTGGVETPPWNPRPDLPAEASLAAVQLELGRTAVAPDTGAFSLRCPFPDTERRPPQLFVQVLQNGRYLTVRNAMVTMSALNPLLPGRAALVTEQATVISKDPTLAELAASVAEAAGQMQAELARYPVSDGAFAAEVELAVPVATAVDELGRLRTRVLDAAPVRSARLRLTVRHLPDAPLVPAASAPVDLAELGLLTEAQIKVLRQLRVFDVAELAAALSRPAARLALEPLGLPLAQLSAACSLLYSAGLPLDLSRALLDSGVRSPQDLLAQDPAVLSSRLGTTAGSKVSREDLARYQTGVRSRLDGRPPETA